MGETFRGIASGGPLIIAAGVAALAGLVSFLSPCILPLVPGYLSYVTGMAGADLNDALNRPTNAARGRIVLGTVGFIAGFTTVFITTTVILANVGRTLLVHERTVQLIVGILIIVLGFAFLGLVLFALHQSAPTPTTANSRPSRSRASHRLRRPRSAGPWSISRQSRGVISPPSAMSLDATCSRR